MIEVLDNSKNVDQELYVKVSPDLDKRDVESTLEIISNNGVKGITTTNSTINHNSRYILNSPRKGGASGNAVYEDSFKIQKFFYENIKCTNLKLIACGGINSKERLNERKYFGAEEFQIFTPIIFSGTRLLRELRN